MLVTKCILSRSSFGHKLMSRSQVVCLMSRSQVVTKLLFTSLLQPFNGCLVTLRHIDSIETDNTATALQPLIVLVKDEIGTMRLQKTYFSFVIRKKFLLKSNSGRLLRILINQALMKALTLSIISKIKHSSNQYHEICINYMIYES